MERSIFRCTTRSRWPSRTTSIWPISAITSPSRKPISSAPKRAAPPTASTPPSSSPPRAVSAASGGGGGASGSGFSRRQWRHRHLDPRRRNQRSVLRSLPHLQGLRRSHRHPGGQPVPGRRAGSEDQHDRGPVELLPVVPHRHERLSVNYLGQRVASNIPYNAINPDALFQFAGDITQPLLAGFGLATNERYIRIAKRNSQITDLLSKRRSSPP